MAYENDITTPAQTSATVPFTVTASSNAGAGYEGFRAFDHSVNPFGRQQGMYLNG